VQIEGLRFVLSPNARKSHDDGLGAESVQNKEKRQYVIHSEEGRGERMSARGETGGEHGHLG